MFTSDSATISSTPTLGTIRGSVNTGIAETKGFDDLLKKLEAFGGFDLGGFNRAGLARRISLRMRRLGIRGFEKYSTYLKNQPEEFPFLINAILISVTSFFHDPSAWKFLSRHIIPRILGTKEDGEPVRVWSAGCSSGQEVYSLAMVFAQAIGMDAFPRRLTIFGTDVDDAALNQARCGAYRPTEMKGVSPLLKEEFFRRENERFVFIRSLRPCIRFSHHDMISDPPFSHLDLLVCRNTLIYFNLSTQERVLARFHAALRDGAYLFLGPSEVPCNGPRLFKEESRQHHIFSKLTPGRNSHSTYAIHH